MPSSFADVNRMTERAPGEGDVQNLTAQGFLVAAMTGLSRISGFARDIAFSYFFGATAVADAFFVAFRIPNFFRRLFAEGAFAQAFVPVLAEYRETGSAHALKLFVRTVAGNFIVVLAGVSIVGVAGAPVLVAIFAPGFLPDEAKFALAVDMARIMFPYLAFIALTAFAGSVLNSFHRYAAPAFTPVLLNLVLITAALIGAPLFEVEVMALAWGVFAAGMVQLLFQFPFLRKIDMLAVPRVEWREPGVRKVGRLLGPAVFAASANQINALVGTILASLLTTGSIAWLYYADRLMELPVGLVAIALGTVLLPNLSRLHSANDIEGFAATLNWGIRVGVILSVPAAVALYMLATPLIATIFYHGAMTALDVGMAAAALQAFAVGLVAWVLVKVAAPGYFARQDTRTPFKFAVVSVVVNMALSLALFIPMGHVGLALATSVAAIVNGYLLIRGLVARGDLTGNRKLARALGATLIAVLCMGLVLGYAVPDAEVWLAATAMRRVGLMSASVAGGAAVYGLTLWLCGLRPADLLHRV